MTTVTLSGPSGSTPRWRLEKAKKRDRRAALRYGRPPVERSPRAPWKPAELWILRNNAYLGETLHDCDPKSAPPWERDGALRLAMLSSVGLPGGAIIDSREALGDVFSQAVILHYLHEREIVVHWGVGKARFKVVDAGDLRALEASVGRAQLKEAIEHYTATWENNLLQRRDEPGFRLGTELAVFGVGPRRDPDLAYTVARLLDEQRWPRYRIREYLQLFGFVNTSGNLGRWNHRQFAALMDKYARSTR